MRLILESITLKNFKSYKGEHIIPNIDKSFTAIVGPNGSGKSNIIDSILFVLGFRAKKMRHTQITDLIYNDGNKESSCFVKLSFNKFSIKREISINKMNKYFYNDKEITNTELIKKMMEEGIDMEHNRFLILQGEIETIAMLKPKEGLLEFLEDIIGTSRYKSKIDALTEEAKNMEDENITYQNNLKFLKTEFEHISDLRKQNEDILLHRLKSNEYTKELKNLNLEFYKRNLNKSEERKKILEKKIEETKNVNKENKDLLKSLEDEHTNIKTLLNQKEESLLHCKREYKKIDRNNTIQKDLKNKLEKEIKNLEINHNNLKAKNEMKIKQNKILNKELHDNELELQDLNNKRVCLCNKQSEEQKNIKKKNLNDFQEIQNYEERLSLLIKNKSEQNQRNLKYKLQTDNLREEEIYLSEEIATIKNKIKECASIKGLNKIQLEKELKDLNVDIQKTENEIQKRKRRYNEVYQREEINKKEKELLNNFSHIKGVIGRLSDIGEVDDKYHLALKTACTRLNNIVVDTTATAEKCIEIIKNKNLQRSTFIIIEKIQEIPKLDKLDMPFVFDLVKCEKKYKKCFYFSLTDTLLAEDLQKAQAYAFGKTRRRVVTLDGKLIEKSGIMTGGKYYDKVKKYEDVEKALNKMITLRDSKMSDIQKIYEFENQKNLKTQLKDKEAKCKEIQQSIKDATKSLKEYDFDKEINDIKIKISNIREKLEKFYDSSLSGELQIVNEKIEILEGRNHEINIILSEQTESLSEIEDRLRAKYGQLDNICILDTKDLKSKLDEEEDSYNELSNDFKNIQESVNNLKKKMGIEYHTEIDLKNQYDDIIENIFNTKNKIAEELNHYNILLEEIENDNKLLEIKQTGEISQKDFSSLSDEDIQDFQRKIQKKLKKMNEEIGKKDVDISIFSEFNKTKESYEKAKEDFKTQIIKYENKKNQVDLLKKSRYTEFTNGLSQVNGYLKEIYKKLTYGGNAELELIDYLDPFSDGIRLAVMPPKKCWKNVSNLSGGEKTLSSLSLIFALHKFKPSPFYVMDEIDAALDFRNVYIISQYIEEMSKSSQFIVISLRNDMFEISKSILGVYKVNNISKFLMINVEEIKKKLST